MVLTKEELKKHKDESKELKAALIIGKSGLTENMFEQIRLYLKANKICKIKISRNFLDSTSKSKKEICQEIVDQTNSTLINQVGNVLVVFRR